MLKRLLSIFIFVMFFQSYATAEELPSNQTEHFKLHKSSIELSINDTPKQITRGELCRLIVDTVGIDRTIYENKDSKFTDVPKSHPYYADIMTVADMAIMRGFSDGSFNPDNSVTRAEYAIIMHRTLGYGKTDKPILINDVDKSHFAYESIKIALGYELMTLDENGNFRPYELLIMEPKGKLIVENPANKAVVWSSSNPAVATVDQTGQVTPKAAGQTTITVKTLDGTLSQTSQVKVTGVTTTNPDTTQEEGQPPNSTNDQSYTVVPGDTLYKIALQNHTTVESLMRENNLFSSSIYVGQVLRIPTTYTVITGDTMYLISKKLGVSLEKLITANPQVKNPTNIYIGQVFNIPGKNQLVTYKVKAGDTMYLIAVKHGISTLSLIQANPQVKKPNLLYIGQTLNIPLQS